MKRSTVIVAFTSLLVLVSSAFAAWEEFKDDKYGFKMLVPGGAKGVAKDFGDGWGGLYFEVDGNTKVYGAAKLGAAATPEEIQKFGVAATGIAADHWESEEKGADKNGFKWYEAYSASNDSKLVAALLGVGPKGNYCIYLESTPAAYEANKADFEKWAESIHVY